MNYAIIELGGKQYRVEKGDSVVVDRIDAKEGSKVSPKAILFRSDKTTVIDGPDLDKVKVEAVVAEHVKGPRIRVFKYRPKKRYRRRAGHRSLLTRIEIGDVSLGTARRAPAKAAEPKAEAEPKAAAPKAAATAKKPAARKAPTRKAPARKAPARKSATKAKED
jgi:large subunit ribosomal protein L21